MDNPTIADLAKELTSDGIRHWCNKQLFSFVNRNLNILGYKAHVLEINKDSVVFAVVVEG